MSRRGPPSEYTTYTPETTITQADDGTGGTRPPRRTFSSDDDLSRGGLQSRQHNTNRQGGEDLVVEIPTDPNDYTTFAIFQHISNTEDLPKAMRGRPIPAVLLLQAAQEEYTRCSERLEATKKFLNEKLIDAIRSQDDEVLAVAKRYKGEEELLQKDILNNVFKIRGMADNDYKSVLPASAFQSAVVVQEGRDTHRAVEFWRSRYKLLQQRVDEQKDMLSLALSRLNDINHRRGMDSWEGKEEGEGESTSRHRGSSNTEGMRLHRMINALSEKEAEERLTANAYEELLDGLRHKNGSQSSEKRRDSERRHRSSTPGAGTTGTPRGAINSVHANSHPNIEEHEKKEGEGERDAEEDGEEENLTEVERDLLEQEEKSMERVIAAGKEELEAAKKLMQLRQSRVVYLQNSINDLNAKIAFATEIEMSEKRKGKSSNYNSNSNGGNAGGNRFLNHALELTAELRELVQSSTYTRQDQESVYATERSAKTKALQCEEKAALGGELSELQKEGERIVQPLEERSRESKVKEIRELYQMPGGSDWRLSVVRAQHSVNILSRQIEEAEKDRVKLQRLLAHQQ